ncbi:shock factor protein 2 [Seminavis robusta]|uniref:Shock factor protein 2 n=1 Tax=Seminavis robusta TaxID=568900 RepID=A0A9N8EUT5_9STRA|nr:shock factor protein 2 [Seminavis robusta]|eukprot:Sro1746_g294990.1 shock factor protein 2 (362) ;mRNA; r:8495-9682
MNRAMMNLPVLPTSGMPTEFPCLLHRCLTEIEELVKRDSDMLRLKSVVCWQRNGASFRVIDKKRFERLIMPVWFPRIKFASFFRLVSMYGFVKISSDGEFYHKDFVMGMPDLAQKIKKVGKGTNARKVNTARILSHLRRAEKAMEAGMSGPADKRPTNAFLSRCMEGSKRGLGSVPAADTRGSPAVGLDYLRSAGLPALQTSQQGMQYPIQPAGTMQTSNGIAGAVVSSSKMATRAPSSSQSLWNMVNPRQWRQDEASNSFSPTFDSLQEADGLWPDPIREDHCHQGNNDEAGGHCGSSVFSNGSSHSNDGAGAESDDDDELPHLDIGRQDEELGFSVSGLWNDLCLGQDFDASFQLDDIF